MYINFVDISSEEIKLGLKDIYQEGKVYFEILEDDCPIGFYGIFDEGDDTCQIDVYINKSHRLNITKKLVVSCLHFPFKLGFNKVLIWTELGKMERLLRKMEGFGVKYLTTEEDKIHWFEVTKDGT